MNGLLRGQAPWGLLGAIVAVTAVEMSVAGHVLDLIRPERFEWALARRAAEKEAPGCDVLCFGTSMVKQGVFPAVIERRAGLRAYNFAVCAGRAESSYYNLRRALAAGARPSAVLMDVHPSFATIDYRTNTDAWRDGLALRDCIELAWAVRDPDFFATIALSKILPTVYNRNEIRDRVLAALRGQGGSLWDINLRHLRNLNRNRGSVVCPRRPEYRGEVSDFYRWLLLGNNRAVNSVQARYIHKLLNLAASHGVRVYWLIPPFAPELQREREVNGLDAAYTRFVQSFRGYPNLVVVDGRRAGYAPSVFLDACHLDPQGAFVFSAGVAEIVRRFRGRRPTGTEWVALPAFREQPIDLPLEDIVQSGLALKDPGSARR